MSDIHDPLTEDLEPRTEVSDPPTAPQKDYSKPGVFQKGHVPTVRRRAGTRNRITTDLKHGIIEGAAKHGEDGKGKGGVNGYLAWAARKYPRDYLKLIGRLLPLDLNATGLPKGSSIGSINIIAAPSNMILSDGKFVEMVEADPPPLIEQQPQPEPDPEEPGIEIVFGGNITRLKR